MNCFNIIELEILEDEANMDLNVEFQGDIIRLSGGEFIETDPTVPEWAKQPNPPTYTPEDIGALSKEDVDQTYRPESENAQSGVAVTEALKNIEVSINAGKFATSEQFKKYPFKTGYLYIFSIITGYDGVKCLNYTIGTGNRLDCIGTFNGNYLNFLIINAGFSCQSNVWSGTFVIGNLPDSELSKTSQNSVQNKIVTQAINNINSQLDGLETLLSNI